MSKTKKIISTAVCIAMCVVLPIALHAIPNVGSLISPMHVPVFICALVCGPFWGVVCGLVGPFLSSVITQMPPIAYLPSMLVELAVYGFACGLLYRRLAGRRGGVYIPLVTAMVLGRVVWGLVMVVLMGLTAQSFTVGAFVSGALLNAIPGIVVQLVLIPLLVAALERASLKLLAGV